MQPEFGITREQHNKLFYQTYQNVGGKFHFHSQIELLFVDEGNIEVWINDTQRVLEKGDMSVALSYDAHVYRSIGESTASIIFIPTYLCEEFISRIKDKRARNHFICDKSAVTEMKACFEKIKKEEDNKIKTMGYIYVILGILMDHIDLESANNSIDPKLSSKLLFYINENYKNDITLSSISSALGYNPSYISRYFKSCFNIGINQYITVARLKNAIMLLNENRYNITYCALESGFNSMRTFYRAFLNEFHCSPSEYISQLKAT